MMQSDERHLYERVDPARLERFEVEPTSGFNEDLRVSFYALWSRRVLIMVITAIGIAIALLYIRVATPLYTSVTEILIDPRKKQVTEGEVVPSGLGSSALGADTALVESQLAIIQSESVIRGIIAREQWDQDTEFIGSNGPLNKMIDLAKWLVYGNARVNGISPYEKAKRKLRKQLQIKRKPNTYVMHIAMRSSDPAKAARIANGLAQIYVSESRNHSVTATLEAASELDGRLEDLRIAASRAAKAVEDYRRENGLIGAQNMLVVEQQLRDTNDQYGLALAATKAAKARLDEARRLLDDPLLVNVQSEIFESSVSNRLLMTLAAARAQEARLSVQLLPSHPRMQAAIEERRSVEAALRRELSRVMERYQVAHNVALQKERALDKQLKQLQSTAAKSNLDSVKLSELSQQARSARSVYEDFLARSKQVKEQIGLHTNNTRIISEAYASSRPSHPNAKLLLAALGFAGLIVGLLIAWLLHILQGTAMPYRPRQTLARHVLQGTAMPDRRERSLARLIHG